MSFWEMLDYLRGINMASICLRLFLACLIGGIIGLERGKKKRPAGFRTHMLVCIGAAIAMMTNQYISTFLGESDFSRLGAQVISGIGFLGAGTIIVTGRQQVKGLTTAAGLWASACTGLAIGIGFYEGALIGALAIFGVIALLHKLDTLLYSNSPVLDIFVEAEDMSKITSMLTYFKAKSIRVSSFETSSDHLTAQNCVTAILTISGPKKCSHAELILELGSLDGILFVEEIG